MAVDTLRQSPSGRELALSSDDIDNDSTVAGSTVTDALDNLGGVLGNVQPGQVLGLQIDAAGPGPPVALSGLELGQNLRIGTRQTYSTAGTHTLVLADDTTRIDKTSASPDTLNGMTGSVSGRIVLLQHSGGGGSLTTIAHNTGTSDSFINPGGVSFAYGADDGFAGLAIYDAVSSRWRVIPRGFSRAENIAWTGQHTFAGSLFTVTATGAVSLTATAADLTLVTTGTGEFIVVTGTVQRLRIEPDGSWAVQSSSGTAGQALITAGASAPPGWGTVGQAGLNGGIAVSLAATTPSATDTTNLSAGATTIAANSTAVGHTWRGVLKAEFVHAAAATPTLTVEWVYGGAVIQTRTITPVAVASTYSVAIEAFLRFTSIGAAASARASIEAKTDVGATLPDQIGSTAAVAAGLNTTISRTLELRIRMTTTVASNTLTLHEAYLERLITS